MLRSNCTLVMLLACLILVAAKSLNSNGRTIRISPVKVPAISIESRAARDQFTYFGSDTINPTNTASSKSNYMSWSSSDFTTRDSRLGFIRKVYAIFGVQMLTTILVTYVMINNPPLMKLIYDNYQLVSFSTLIVSLGVIGNLVANPTLRHRAPINFVLLGIHTLMQSIMVGAFSYFFSPMSIMVGAMHTLSVFLAITVYSLQPNPQYDLSGIGNTLLSCLTALLVGTVCSLFFNVPLVENVLSAASAVLFGVYLFVDTQKIVGGTHHKYQYGQKEYILAALNLYQDAISLYMHLVKLLGEQKSERRNSK